MADYGYQILVTKAKICNGGRIFYISANFTSNSRALNSKYFTY